MKRIKSRIWMSLGLAAALAVVACAPAATTEAGEAGADIAYLPAGEAVDLVAQASPGKVTVYDFYAEWCAPCRILTPALEKLVRERPDQLALRKVDVIDWESATAEAQQIEELPYLAVVDADGSVAAEGDASFDFIKERFGVDLMAELRATLIL